MISSQKIKKRSLMDLGGIFSLFSSREISLFFSKFELVNFLNFSKEIENGGIEKMNYGYREQKLSELGVNDQSFEQG